MPPLVSAVGEQTTLSERKRRAGQRLLLGLPDAHLGYDQRAVLGLLSPAGFVLDPTTAEEPGQIRELSAELTARLPPALPPILAARHAVGRPCPGCVDLPPIRWLARADDPDLTQRVGQAWRLELAALGFHLHLGPRCELEPLPGEPLPCLGTELEPLLAGPDARQAARTVGAFVATQPGDACAPCPSLCPGWVRDDRLVPYEQELPGLLAEDLLPVAAAVGAGVPALLVGWGLWPAFDEDSPCWCLPALLQEQLRVRLGFGGLLLGEDPTLAPPAERLRRDGLLWAGIDAGLDLWVLGADAPAQVALFEALVKLQERYPGLEHALDLSQKRLLRGRQRLMLGIERPGLEVLDSPAHRDLVLLARARGS